MPWIETLTVTSSQPLNVIDVFDDIKREEAFYNQALEAVQLAKEQNPDAFKVPENFIAPMLKDDEHMKQVYQKLVAEAKEGNEEAVYRLQAFEKQRKKAARVDEKQKMLSRSKLIETIVSVELLIYLGVFRAKGDQGRKRIKR